MIRAGIDQGAALRLQLAMIAGNEPDSSFLEIRRLDPPGRNWIPVRQVDAAAMLISRLASRHQVYVGAAPRVRRSGTAADVERVWTVWADCDSAESVKRLRAFPVAPSIVVRSGTDGHLHGWWQLSSAISPAYAVRANRRLALALGADRAATDAARIMRPSGSLNHKTRPPRPVACVHLEPIAYTLAEVVGQLDDDPAYTSKPSRRPSSTSSVAALAGLVRVVREAPVGERNRRLNWAAYCAGEHALAGGLDRVEVESELLAAATDIGLPEREAACTIASGLTAAGRRAA